MKYYLAIALLYSLISGCSNQSYLSFPKVHKINVQQGNVITENMIKTLHPGLTRSQVQRILGTTLVNNTFDANRWDYVYETYSDNKFMQRKKLSIYFVDNLLNHIK